MECLEDGTEIRLGFYWHGAPDVLTFRKVLRWLLERGYDMYPEVLAVQAPGPWMPRISPFPMRATCDLEIATLRWTPTQVLDSNAPWLPLQVQLQPRQQGQIPLRMGYGVMPPQCVATDEPHTIVLVASGAAAELVLYGEPGQALESSNLDLDVERLGQATLEWEKDTYRAICEELAPDVGGDHWGVGLVPPSGLLALSDEEVFDHLFLHQNTIQPEAVTLALRETGRWVIDRFGNGISLVRTQPGSPELYSNDIAKIREWLRARFVG